MTAIGFAFSCRSSLERSAPEARLRLRLSRVRRHRNPPRSLEWRRGWQPVQVADSARHRGRCSDRLSLSGSLVRTGTRFRGLKRLSPATRTAQNPTVRGPGPCGPRPPVDPSKSQPRQLRWASHSLTCCGNARTRRGCRREAERSNPGCSVPLYDALVRVDASDTVPNRVVDRRTEFRGVQRLQSPGARQAKPVIEAELP